MGDPADKCTPELCHKNPKWTHCTKKWCDEKANKGKFGCADPTKEQNCEWNGKECDYAMCSKNQKWKFCTKDYCDKHLTDTQCFDGCVNDKCTAELCHKNPKWTHCTKDWCDEKANKGKFGCKAPTKDQNCEWNGKDCDYEMCKKNPTWKFCTKDYCDKHLTDTQCFDGCVNDKCTAELCHKNPKWTHCTKDWCDEKANKGKFGCKAPTKDQNCEWNGKDCDYEMCKKNPTWKFCTKDYCDKHLTDTQCFDGCVNDKCTVEDCLKNPKWTHCTKDWCGVKANKDKFGCKTPTKEQNCEWTGKDCDYKMCKANPTWKFCTKDYCDKHLKDTQCFDGCVNDKCTAESCHENPKWTHCTKDWCDVKANKDKFGCKAATDDEKCKWNAKDCTYKFCQTTDGKKNIHCKAAWCTKTPSSPGCWDPSTPSKASCKYGKDTNCNALICHENPTLDHCKKAFCNLQANKGKYGCTNPNKAEDCEWNGKCTFEQCKTKTTDKTYPFCSKDYCKKHESDV